MSGSNTRDLVGGLGKPRRGKASTKRKSPQGSIIPKAGKGLYVSSAGANKGGIASPLTEVTTSTSREYYSTPVTMYSTDGIFSFTVNGLKKIVMKDATGTQVEFIYKQYPLPE